MDGCKVWNAGFPGDTTRELLRRFESDVAAWRPDAVVLLIGGNDMLYPGHMLELDEFKANFEKLADRIAAVGARLIVMTPAPLLEKFLVEQFPETLRHPLSVAERLNALRGVIRAVAAARQLPVIDLERVLMPVDESAESVVMNPANSGRRDGLHLTAAGCGKVAQAVAAALASYCPEARGIVCFGDSITHGVYLFGRGTARIDAETYPGQLLKLLTAGKGDLC